MSRKKFTEKYPTFIPSIISMAMLLLAIPPIWPYGYYMFLRWVVCGISIFIVITANELGRKGWMWTVAVIAFLFNPLIPVYLDKDMWVVIDFIVAIIIFTSIWFLKNK